MQPVQPVPTNTGTTTPATRENISPSVLMSQIDQEIAYRIAFKAAKAARLIESGSYAEEYEKVLGEYMKAEERQKLASLQMTMNKSSSHSENAVRVYAANNVR